MKKLLIFILASLTSNLASACSCGDVSLEKAFSNSKNVMIVRFVSIEKEVESSECINLQSDKTEKCDEEYLIGKVDVIDVLKGKVPGEVKVYGMPENYGCHEPMEVGDEIILFLDSELETSYNSCSANRLLRFVDSKVLNEWKSKKGTNKVLKKNSDNKKTGAI